MVGTTRGHIGIRLRAGVAALCVLTVLALPGGSSRAAPSAKTLPVLRLNYYTPPRKESWTLDPALPDFVAEVNTISLVQANLVRLLPDGRPVPDLATWKVSKSHLVYTFTIRKNARFSDGHRVTASDAAFSLRRALAPSSRSPLAASYLALIQGAAAYHAGKASTVSGVKVLDTLTLQITITEPAAYFLAMLAYSTGDVVDPALVAGKPVAGPHNYMTDTCKANQGAGPFTFACANSGIAPHSFYSGPTPSYTLVPNPYYYGHKPHIEIQLPVLNRPPNPYTRYLLSKLDTTFLPLPYLGRWKDKSKEYWPVPSSAISFLLPDTTTPPFNNVHCRLAVAYAIDRKLLADRIDAGGARASYTIVPKGMLGFYDGNDNPHYSLSRAREELARCPSRTVPFTFKYPGGDNESAAVVTMLSAAGLNVKPVPLQYLDWLSAVGHPLNKTNTQLASSAWIQDYPDPQDYCTTILRSGYNVAGWHNATYDRLVDRAQFALKWQLRNALYVQAQHIALNQGVFISLTNAIQPQLLKPYVHGMVASEWTEDLSPRDGDWSNISISKH